jgi:hypothetical protein
MRTESNQVPHGCWEAWLPAVPLRCCSGTAGSHVSQQKCVSWSDRKVWCLAKWHIDPRPSTPPHTCSVMYGPIVGIKHSPLGGNCRVDGSKTSRALKIMRTESNQVPHVCWETWQPAVPLQRCSGTASSHVSQQIVHWCLIFCVTRNLVLLRSYLLTLWECTKSHPCLQYCSIGRQNNQARDVLRPSRPFWHPQIPTSVPHTCQYVHMENGTPLNKLWVLRTYHPIARVY